MLHYKTYTNKNQKDWVVFIHGAGGSSSIWSGQVRDFRKNNNVLLIDLRDHGKSKNLKPLKKYTFNQISKDVIEVIDYLKIEKAHFVGISLGTIIIKELAKLQPNRIKSMILAGAITRINPFGKFLISIASIFKSILPFIILYKLFAFIIMPKKNHTTSRRRFVEQAKKLHHKDFLNWFRLTHRINKKLTKVEKSLSSIPTLYVMGSEDYMFIGDIKKLIKIKKDNVKLEIIPNCGHVVNIEQPKLFNEVCNSYLKNNF